MARIVVFAADLRDIIAARGFFEQGYGRMISLIEAGNEASMKAHSRVGAVPLATLTRVRVGRLELVWKDWSLQHFRRRPRPFVLAARVP